MKAGNVIQTKSFAFAVKVVGVCRNLMNEKREYVMSKQLLKSATSVGANIEEAIGAQSKRDFLAKLSIAYKEARESVFWIRLLNATGYLEEHLTTELLNDAEELCRIIGSIQISVKKQLRMI
jgi:four helix bundle protein